MNNLFDPNTTIGAAFNNIFNTGAQANQSAPAPTPSKPAPAVARIAPAHQLGTNGSSR